MFYRLPGFVAPANQFIVMELSKQAGGKIGANGRRADYETNSREDAIHTRVTAAAPVFIVNIALDILRE